MSDAAELDGLDPEVRARKLALRTKERYRERLEAGLCVSCVRPNPDAGTQTCCPDCRTRHADGRAQRRRRTSRPKITISNREMRELDAEATDHDRPRTRGDCKDGYRPCPYALCRHWLGLDVTEAGSIAMRPVGGDSCALDVADRGEHSLDEVGEALGVTREMIRLIEVKALLKLRRLGRAMDDLLPPKK